MYETSLKDNTYNIILSSTGDRQGSFHDTWDAKMSYYLETSLIKDSKKCSVLEGLSQFRMNVTGPHVGSFVV